MKKVVDAAKLTAAELKALDEHYRYGSHQKDFFTYHKAHCVFIYPNGVLTWGSLECAEASIRLGDAEWAVPKFLVKFDGLITYVPATVVVNGHTYKLVEEEK